MRRPRLLGTSSFRLALTYAVLTGVSFLLLYGVIFWSTTQFMRHQIDDSIDNEINEVTTDEQSVTLSGMQLLVQGMSRHASGFYYLLQNTHGIVLAGNLPSLDPTVGIREWGGAGKQRPTPYSELRGRGVAVPGGYLFVGWSTFQLHEMEEFVGAAFLWGLGASIVLALGGGVMMSRRLMRKIENVSETSRNIIRGDLKQRVPVQQGGDEFDHLGSSINAMLDRIETLMDDVRQVTTDIAHDLRTPLTRLRNRLEFAQRGRLEENDLREVIAAARRETDVILEIFTALLRIAQIESGARKARFDRVDLSEIVDTVHELYGSAAEERQQRLLADTRGSVIVNGDRELLTQMLANLVENAVRHGGAGCLIRVAAAESAQCAEIRVDDTGPGIPMAMRDKVQQRFFRLEESRTTPGSGLGLSLAVAIAKLHDASVILGDNHPGLRIAITFELPATLASTRT